MCRERIEKAAKEIDGVISAGWDASTKQLHLHYDPSKTTPDSVLKAVAAAGHDTDRYRAGDSVYNALPECCKYRK
jgi:Cu(I)/Ag(I) efflux system membrane fusion protein